MVDELVVQQQTNLDSYYRSHLYTSYQGINPLITAAHPLLSIIDRLQLSRKIVTNTDFYNNLKYELEVFNNRALSADYDEETIFIGHFLLSASINEKVQEQENFDTFTLLMPEPIEHSINDSSNPDEQFFKILDKIIDKPDHYLDLLELVYLCLSLGFEGKYKKSGNDDLKNIAAKLFKIISKQKCYKKKSLFASSENKPPEHTKSSKWPYWLIASTIFIGLTFFTSNYFLDKKAINHLITSQLNYKSE